MPVVDGHLHLFREVSDEYPRPVYEGMTPPERAETAEELLVAMDEAGVDHAVVVALSQHDEYLRDVLRDHPGTFAGVGLFEFDGGDPVEQVERRVDETGMQGFRFYGLNAPAGVDPESIAVFPALEAMQAHDLKVWFYGSPDQLEILDSALDHLTDLKVVLNHLGFCPDITMELRIDEDGRPRFDIDLPPTSLELVERVAARHPNVYVQFSGLYAFTREPYPYLDLKETTERIYQAFGASRMLMASDWPWIKVNPGYEPILDLVNVHLPDLSEEERRAIRGETAASLFSF